MTILVTGVAGFIGMHVAKRLLAAGHRVVGIDNLNDYYAPALKQARLAQLDSFDSFHFLKADIADKDALDSAIDTLAPEGRSFTRIVHLAGQAGVRYSLDNPHAYVAANVTGHLNMLELARRQDGLEHMVYASSSSVYGGNRNMPFSEQDRVDTPVSLYAATKRADELMSHTYAHLFGIPLTGLRFFTVYGPWGRPDMAYWLFTDAILNGRPIKVFNQGDMLRDFTYIDDIAAGVDKVLDLPPQADAEGKRLALYNIGNHRPESLLRFIEILEDALGKKAHKDMLPMQPGDVHTTCADISALHAATGFMPETRLEDGLPAFVEWYRDFHKI